MRAEDDHIEAFGWRNESLSQAHRLQLAFLESLSWVSRLSEELNRQCVIPEDLDQSEALHFQQEALRFVLKLDPLELGDFGDTGPAEGQISIFD